AGLSPVIALSVGICAVVVGGLFARGDRQRLVVSVLTLATLAAAARLCIWQWTAGPKLLVAGALRLDDLGLAATLIVIACAAFVVPLSWREPALEHPVGPAGHAEFQTLLLSSVLGMTLLASAQILVGIGLAATGLAFKTSIAPFHQWTPDVYQGAPTPVTAFMAVATKAAAFAVFIRFFLVALGPAADNWQPALAALAAISIAVGNIGALGQDSLKRLLGYSGIAQAGYMLVGLVAASETGVNALVFY